MKLKIFFAKRMLVKHNKVTVIYNKNNISD